MGMGRKCRRKVKIVKIEVRIDEEQSDERRLERSDGKLITPPSYITENLPLVALLLISSIIPTPFAIHFAHRRKGHPPNHCKEASVLVA